MKRLCKHTSMFLILTLLLFLTSGLFPMFAMADEQEGCEYKYGDWVIDTNVTMENYTVVLSDNLTVNENGVLLLSNSKLLLNSTHGKITVKKGGKLLMRNTTIMSPYQHSMYLYGEAKFEICSFINLEIQVMSSTVVIANSTVENSSGYGIVIKDSSPQIINNTIMGNKGGGIITMGSGVLISGNKVINNGGDGIYSEDSADTLISNEIGENGGMGVNLSNSYSRVENNTVFNNTIHAVFLRGGGNVLNSNRFEGNKWGIKLVDSAFTGENNTFLQNENGEISQCWNLTVKILNSNWEGIEDVSVAITNRDGTMFWGGIVSCSFSRVLPEYEIVDNTTRIYSPYFIYAEKNSSWAEEVVILNQSRQVVLKLLINVDIEIENIFIPAHILPGKNTEIKIFLNNTYESGIRIPVTILIDNNMIYNSTVILAGYSKINISVVWYATSGTHKIEVFIDKNDDVEEVNETNNYAYKWITVGETKNGEMQIPWFYLIIIGITMMIVASVIIILRRKT